MRSRVVLFGSILTAAGLLIWMAGAALARPIAPPASWDARAAAAYLDQRQGWWESWPKAARDHGTVCVSCHTAVPYALARPALGALLHEEDAPAAESRLLADVVTRVREWNTVKPFYGDTTSDGRTKALQSRGTEAVLNALILASRDERSGTVSPEARQAFANMFALQQSDGDEAGSWPWLDFGLRPWESSTAAYFGAALAAVAVGIEPRQYAGARQIQPNVNRLRAYLRDHLDQPLWRRLLRRDDPRLFNRAMLLWASASLPGLATRDEQRSMIEELWRAQAPDGAWALTSLGSWHSDASTEDDAAGDGLATGLVADALEAAGTSPNDPRLAWALAWLARHQDTSTGMWRGWSLNKQRDLRSNVGKFMSDAATGYAVLALTGAHR